MSTALLLAPPPKDFQTFLRLSYVVGGPPGSTPNVVSCVFLDDTLHNWTVTFIFARFKYLSALIFRVLIQTVKTCHGTLCKTIFYLQSTVKSMFSSSFFGFRCLFGTLDHHQIPFQAISKKWVGTCLCGQNITCWFSC